MSTLCETSKESPYKPDLNEADTPKEEAHSKRGLQQDLGILNAFFPIFLEIWNNLLLIYI